MADDPNDDASFQPLSSIEAAAGSAGNQATNVYRAAVLSASVGQPAALQGLDEELELVGIRPAVASRLRTWDRRQLIRGASQLVGPFAADDEGRVTAWRKFVTTPTPPNAVSYLLRLLGSTQDRESVTAAAALWRILGPRAFRDRRAVLGRMDLDLELPGPSMFDEPLIEAAESDQPQAGQWSEERWWVAYNAEIGMPVRRIRPATVARFAVARLSWGLRSHDPITRSLAHAAFTLPATGSPSPPPPPARTTSRPEALSTMVHGTFAFRGDWWRPGGDFHSWVLRNHRPSLYAGGARHCWSGSLLQTHRITAANDLCDWVADRAPDGLLTLFGHSFGGEVAARAVFAGAATDQLVLLSCPVTAWVQAIAGTMEVIDVRLRLDPVLLAGGLPQRFLGTAPTASEIFWHANHAATHNPDVWEARSIAAKTGL